MQNESGEDGNTLPWRFGTLGNDQSGLSLRDIPNELREQETYKIKLQVTDSNNLVSDAVEVDVIGNGCDTPL